MAIEVQAHLDSGCSLLASSLGSRKQMAGAVEPYTTSRSLSVHLFAEYGS